VTRVGTRRVGAKLVLLAMASTLAAVGLSGLAVARQKRPPLRYASPAAIVAADVALSQLAQRKGQWTALRATSAEGAVMFVPQPVIARDWLKAQQDPAQPVAWQPQQVWLSCDGSLAVSYGASQQAGGSPGYFTTVWQRQPKGDYRWIMTQSDTLAAAMTAPDMIGAGVATCERATHSPSQATRAAPTAAPAFPASARGGWSEDRTLNWSMSVGADCSRALTVSLYRGKDKPMDPVLQKRVAGKPGAACSPS
jgi:hypothetical protein